MYNVRENANHNGLHPELGLHRPPDAAPIFKRGSADVMEEQAPDQESHSERAWVEGIKQGDAAALEALFRAYYDELYGFAWRYVSVSEIAEDLVQGVFVRIWQRRRSWNPRAMKSYLYGAVRNEALRYLKHEEVVRRWEEEAHIEEPSPVRTPDQEFGYKELAEAIEEVIEQLPERRRLVFVLHRQHELTYREIAELLDISQSTVEIQISRALDALRRLLSVLVLL